MGDFNCEIKRTQTDLRLQIVSSFISDYNVIFDTTDLEQRRCFTFHCENNNFFKMLDHYPCSINLHDSIDDIYCVKDKDDVSDHKPLITVFKCNINRKSSLKKDAVRYPCWDLNAKEIYYETTRNSLE